MIGLVSLVEMIHLGFPGRDDSPRFPGRDDSPRFPR